MIKIVLTVGDANELLEVKASGHANCGTAGNDPVCAAVSFLLRNLALYLGASCEVEAKTRGTFNLKVKKSFLQNSANNKELSLSELQTLFKFARIGIESLVAEVPDSVKLEIRKV